MNNNYYKTILFKHATDGTLDVFERRLGQNVNGRNYSGFRQKLIEWIIQRYFLRVDKKMK